jgi:uncharacterized protein YlxW (UPF0749 family)
MSDIAAPRVVRTRTSRFGIWAVLIVVVAALVSFFAVSQLRTSNRFTQDLSSQDEGDLARILSSLSSESTAQQQQLSLLKVELANLQNASTAQGTASQAVNSQLNSLEVLAGTTPVTGPGLEIDVSDPNKQVTYDVVVDTIEELRDAGAEALAVNGQRIGVESYFGPASSGSSKVSLDGVGLSAPLTISAIGPAATMEGGLEIPGGSLDTLRALNGASVQTHRLDTLNLPALSHPPQFHAAHAQ